MIHFQTKGHIVGWLERHCPRPGIVRAINGGKVELLGGFSSVPPDGRSGWIIRVTSPLGRVWLVAITPNKKGDDYAIRLLKQIPWEHWSGNSRTSKLYRGDRPWLYSKLAERKRR